MVRVLCAFYLHGDTFDPGLWRAGLSSCSSVCGLNCPFSVGTLESVVFAFWRGDGRKGPLYECLFFLICWSCWVNCTCREKLFWKTILFIKVIYSDKPIKASLSFSLSLSLTFSISLSLDVDSTLWVTAKVIVCLKSLKYVLMFLEWIKSKSANFTPFHGCELVLLSKLYGTPKYVIRFCLLNFSQHLSGGLIIAFDTPVARFYQDKILQLCKCFIQALEIGWVFGRYNIQKSYNLGLVIKFQLVNSRHICLVFILQIGFIKIPFQVSMVTPTLNPRA